jgi:hypothetical protein
MVLLLSGVGVEFVLCVTSRLLVTDSHKAKAMPAGARHTGKAQRAAQTAPRRGSAARLAEVGRPRARSRARGTRTKITRESLAQGIVRQLMPQGRFLLFDFGSSFSTIS